MALAERSLVLARNGKDEAWMNVWVGNSEPQRTKNGPSSKYSNSVRRRTLLLDITTRNTRVGRSFF